MYVHIFVDLILLFSLLTIPHGRRFACVVCSFGLQSYVRRSPLCVRKRYCVCFYEGPCNTTVLRLIFILIFPLR